VKTHGKKLIGTMIRMIRNPAVAVLAKNAGLDFIMLDCEHGGYSWETLSDICLAARSVNLGAFVRVPELSRGWVSRSLDCGITGVMAPHVETVEQAKMLAVWSRYAPRGERGLGTAGGHTDYKPIKDAQSTMARINDEVLVIAQIETARGVEAACDIAKVDGIDALLVGPNDLAVSLGYPGQTDHGEIHRAIGYVASAAQVNGKIFGMHAGMDLLRRWIPRGMRLIMNSLDINVVANALAQIRCDIEGLTD